MATRDDVPEEGTEPQEEVGPEGCEPSPDECGFVPMVLDAPPEGSEFGAKEELQEAMRVEAIDLMNDPVDGLVRPVDSPVQFSPPFTYERLVCIEDARLWVELFDDELDADTWCRLYAEDASDHHVFVPRRKENEEDFSDRFTVRERYDANGLDRDREQYKPSQVITLWGQNCVKIGQDAFRPVRPVRPACRNYKRQCFNNDDEPDPTAPGGRIHFTHCTVRRSIGGAFMSLRDQNVFACDHRDPPDEKTARYHLDLFEQRRLRARAHETLVPLFGLAGEEVRTEGDE